MKKLASRVLALVIALSLLLASTAMAAERNAANLSVAQMSQMEDDAPFVDPTTGEVIESLN